MNGAIVIRWGATARDRETKALEVFMEAQQYYGDLAKQGRVHDVAAWINVVGTQGGCMFVTGDLNELMTISAEQPTLDLQLKAGLIVDDFSTTICAGGNEQSLGELLGRGVQIEQEMGYFQT